MISRFSFISLLLFASKLMFSQLNADFSLVSETGCAPMTAEIINNSSGTGDLVYTWDFGAGTAASNANDKKLFYSYETPGEFTITLQLTDGTETKTVTKKVRVFDPPRVKVAEPEMICQGKEFEIEDISEKGDADIVSQWWIFNDGKTYTQKKQTYAFPLGGNFNYFHKIKDENGCEADISGMLHVNEIPVPDFEMDKEFSCDPPLTVNFTNTSAFEGSPAIGWEVDGESLASLSSRTFTDKGEYEVTLFADYGNECSGSVTKTVRILDVNADFAVYNGRSAFSSNLVPEGQAAEAGYITLKNTSIGTKENKWIIKGEEITANQTTVLLCEPGEHEVTLIAGLEYECSDTLTTTVTVGPNANVITARQGTKQIKDGLLCYGNTRFTNPLVGSNVVWTYQGTEYTENTFSQLFCDDQSFSLTAKCTLDECVLEYTQDFTVSKCEDYKFDIRVAETDKPVDFEGSNCAGKFRFKTTGVDSAEMLVPIYNYWSDEIEYISFFEDTVMPMCKIGKVYPKIIGTFENGCYDTATVAVNLGKCNLPTFKMFKEAGTEIADNQHLCPGDSILILVSDNVVTAYGENLYTAAVDDPFKIGLEGRYEKDVQFTVRLDNSCYDTVSRPVYLEYVSAEFEYTDTIFNCPAPIGGTVKWNGTNAESFQWSLITYDDTTTNISHIGTGSSAEFLVDSFALKQERYNPRSPIYYELSTQLAVKGPGPLYCVDTVNHPLYKATPKTWLEFAAPYDNRNLDNYNNERIGCAPLEVELHGYAYPAFDTYDTIIYYDTIVASEPIEFDMRRLVFFGPRFLLQIYGAETDFYFQEMLFPDIAGSPSLKLELDKEEYDTKNKHVRSQEVYENPYFNKMSGFGPVGMYNGMLNYWGEDASIDDLFFKEPLYDLDLPLLSLVKRDSTDTIPILTDENKLNEDAFIFAGAKVKPGSYYPDEIPAGQRIVFVDTVIKPSINKVSKLVWDFGDGTTKEIETVPALYYDYLKKAIYQLDPQSYNRVKIERAFRYYSHTELLKNLKLNLKEDDYHKVTSKAAWDAGLYQTHVYETEGIYQPSIYIADDKSCDDRAYTFNTVEVGRKVDVDFTIDRTSVCLGDSVKISASGADSALVDSWHYFSGLAHLNTACAGMASPELKASPNEIGTTDISLRAEYNGCFTDIVKTDALEINGPIAAFEYDFSCDDPYRYEFTSLSQGADSIVWEFSNGYDTIIENELNPVVVFDSSANVKVSLRAINTSSACPDTAYRMTVFPRQIKAGFTLPRSVYCANERILFHPDSCEDQSGVREIEPFAWYVNGRSWGRTYGNTGIQTENFPPVNTITLIAQDINRCTDTVTKTAHQHMPSGEFEFLDEYLCAPSDSVSLFYDITDSTIAQAHVNGRYFVNINDTLFTPTDSIRIPATDVGNYMPKNFTLTLVDLWGCKNYFTDGITTYDPQARFEDTMRGCLGLPLDLVNDDNKIDSIFWKVYHYDADSQLIMVMDTATESYKTKFVFEDRGDYSIDMIVSKGRCRDTMTYTDIVNVEALETKLFMDDSVICNGDSVTFTHVNLMDSITRGIWDFDDGTTMGLDTNIVSHIYSAGFYRPSLTVYTKNGCTAIKEYDLVVNGADFTATTKNCAGTEVPFTYIDKTADSLIWNFGDTASMGTTESLVRHTYAERGTYTVTLVALKEGCNDTLTQERYVDVQDVHAVIAHDNGRDTICIKDEVKFNVADTNQVYRVNWFYDGQNQGVNDNTYSILLTEMGPHTIKLGVSSSYGCKDETDTLVVVSSATASFTATPDKVCRLDPVTYKMESPTGVTGFRWILGDGQSDTTQTELVHKYTQKGKIKPTLKIWDVAGCEYEIASQEVYVEEVDADFSVKDLNLCEDVEAVEIEEKTNLATKFAWDYGDGFTLNTKKPESHIYSQGGNYTLSLAVENNIGCKDTFSIELNIIPTPEVEIKTNERVCLDDESVVTVETSVSGSKTIVWKIDGVEKQEHFNEDEIKLYLQKNTNFQVMLEDKYRCKNADTLDVVVLQYPNHRINPLDTTIIIYDELQLSAKSNYSSTYEWTPNESISCADCPNPVVNPLDDKDYHLVVKDECFEREYDISIKVVEMEEYDVPDAFTPNSDGENDILFVRGWGIKQMKSFQVYNRWGQLIFSTDDMKKGWDGTYKGKAQPADTYVYTVEVENYLGEIVKKKGYVTLMR